MTGPAQRGDIIAHGKQRALVVYADNAKYYRGTDCVYAFRINPEGKHRSDILINDNVVRVGLKLKIRNTHLRVVGKVAYLDVCKVMDRAALEAKAINYEDTTQPIASLSAVCVCQYAVGYESSPNGRMMPRNVRSN